MNEQLKLDKKKFSISPDSLRKYLSIEFGILGTQLSGYDSVEIRTIDVGLGGTFYGLFETNKDSQLALMILPNHCWLQLINKALFAQNTIKSTDWLESISFADGKVEVST